MSKVTIMSKSGSGSTGGRNLSGFVRESIGASPVVVTLADYDLDAGAAFTFEVVPDIGNDPEIAIRVDVSYDNGTSYALVDSFSKFGTRRYVKQPNESGSPTHVMFSRVAGTSVQSYFIIKD